MPEQIYLRSASSDRDYRWYEYSQGETWVCPDPEPWAIVRGLMAHEETCLSVLGDRDGRCACVVTGLPSPRMANSRYIFDTWIIEGSDGHFSDTQRGLLAEFLLNKGERIRALSDCIDDVGREGVQVRPGCLETELQELAASARRLPEESTEDFPVGTFLDGPEARLRLAESLAARNGVECGQILALVTCGVRPERISGRTIWGLTDHSQARPLPAKLEPGSMESLCKPKEKSSLIFSLAPPQDPGLEDQRECPSWNPEGFRLTPALRAALWMGIGTTVIVTLALFWWLKRD